ncbi:hypothetical protein J8F10_36220 [Gemmata sp. G18]|uniref:HEAT repeat domain-containing protein n=1 Tax=Gemmata palustris TaxID=2822762 RepID=A0ABS5C6H3_9BACT|nr:hypothetical protein [Gemmata palustris]MBP3960703.1 hypothetical protein [Gemmata palustris]
MAVTVEEIDQALSAYLSSGPFMDFELQQHRWERWLAQLTSEDLPLLVQETIQRLNRLNRFDTSDLWLLYLLICLSQAGSRDPEMYINQADNYRRTHYRSIFFSTVGELFSEDAIDWLIAVLEHETLSPDEIKLAAQSSFFICTCDDDRSILTQFITSPPLAQSKLLTIIGNIRLQIDEDIATQD